jgi:bacteriocin-like protein
MQQNLEVREMKKKARKRLTKKDLKKIKGGAIVACDIGVRAPLKLK